MRQPKPYTIEEVEMRPDAWERTEAAVKAALRQPVAPTPKPKSSRKPSVVVKRKT
jgi:hypothetical protein